MQVNITLFLAERGGGGGGGGGAFIRAGAFIRINMSYRFPSDCSSHLSSF